MMRISGSIQPKSESVLPFSCILLFRKWQSEPKMAYVPHSSCSSALVLPVDRHPVLPTRLSYLSNKQHWVITKHYFIVDGKDVKEKT